MSTGSKKLKDGTKKRKLGRNPRVPFTQHQVSLLEQKFRRTHYLSSVDVAELSTALNLTENRVRYMCAPALDSRRETLLFCLTFLSALSTAVVPA